MHGQFVWYDLMTSDVAGAKRFYKQIAGWKTVEFKYASPDRPYSMWSSGKKMLGGVSQLPKEQADQGIPPYWVSSVQVNNVDDTLRKATSLGGRVIAPAMDIPETGRYGVIDDPQGATIALFQPSGAYEGFDGTPVIGQHSWNELMTTDYKRAFDFYRQLFGWEQLTEMDMGGGLMYLVFGLNGKQYGGMYTRTPDMASVPPFWLPYINVKDAKATTKTAERAGAKLVRGPMDVPGGWISIMADPQGAAFAVHSVDATMAASGSKPKAKTKAKAKAKAKPKARKAGAKKASAKKAVRKVKAAGAAKAKRSKTKARTKAKSRPKAKARPRARARKARRR